MPLHFLHANGNFIECITGNNVVKNVTGHQQHRDTGNPAAEIGQTGEALIQLYNPLHSQSSAKGLASLLLLKTTKPGSLSERTRLHYSLYLTRLCPWCLGMHARKCLCKRVNPPDSLPG